MPILRPYGSTGMVVSLLGFGAGHIGDPAFSEKDCGAFLHGLLDAGVTLVDTARGYGLSEERIGRHLARRRGEFILSTKVGYGVEEMEDWTHACVVAGVDRALKVLRTDHLDIVHLHSCPRETLAQGGVIEALEQAKAAGKIRAMAYSGENEALAFALASGRFDGVQCSLNLCDQRVLGDTLPATRAQGLGLIAKRPLANAPWRWTERPAGEYCEVYWARLKAMGLDPGDLDWPELALRFAAFHEGVSSCIVGTTKLEHLKVNLRFLEKGPLPADRVDAIRAVFAACDGGWDGQI
ncbi:aldo/keto reductase [Geothrix paludis]|uniref:aldo/keto reductase n=1 Tax=Geothrix paludis TaxID=2922722 RepID=UPI001FADC0DD|nr:aldo/keto reductase [Geothrix paludis]